MCLACKQQWKWKSYCFWRSHSSKFWQGYATLPSCLIHSLHSYPPNRISAPSLFLEHYNHQKNLVCIINEFEFCKTLWLCMYINHTFGCTHLEYISVVINIYKWQFSLSLSPSLSSSLSLSYWFSFSSWTLTDTNLINLP